MAPRPGCGRPPCLPAAHGGPGGVREARRGARYSPLENWDDVGRGGATVGVEDRLDLAVALRVLTPKQRAVVVLRYLEDLPVEQVARTLRVSEGTVKRQCYDAVRRLRPLLRPPSSTAMTATSPRSRDA